MNDQKKSGSSSEQRSSLAYTQIAWGLMLVSFFFLFIPALVAAGFAIAGLRNRDYCNSTGRKINLASVVLLVLLALCFVPALVYWGIKG